MATVSLKDIVKVFGRYIAVRGVDRELLQFTWIWNDFLFSSVRGNREAVRSTRITLQIFHGRDGTDGSNLSLTAMLIASLHAIALFWLLRYFMEACVSPDFEIE